MDVGTLWSEKDGDKPQISYVYRLLNDPTLFHYLSTIDIVSLLLTYLPPESAALVKSYLVGILPSHSGCRMLQVVACLLALGARAEEAEDSYEERRPEKRGVVSGLHTGYADGGGYEVADSG